MIGYLHINSTTADFNEITSKPCTRINFTIQYNDGQIVRTDLKIDKTYVNFEDAYELISKYFKGDLVIR